MSDRRKGGSGQSGQLCRGEKAREAANCSGKPGAPPAGRAPGKKFGKKKPPENSGGVGEYGTRTHGLLIANQSLYQLS